MTKAQALLYCKEKAKYEGWITHIILLDLYDDNEDIPEYFINLVCHPPEAYKPITLYVGEEGYKIFKKAAEDNIMYIAQSEIIEEFNKKSKN